MGAGCEIYNFGRPRKEGDMTKGKWVAVVAAVFLFAAAVVFGVEDAQSLFSTLADFVTRGAE